MPEQAKPAGVSGGHREIVVSKWKAYENNTLRAFFSITLPSGMVLHNLTFHERDGKRWTGAPSQSYTKEGGGTGYVPLVEFDCAEARSLFLAAVLAAVDRYLKGAGC